MATFTFVLLLVIVVAAAAVGIFFSIRGNGDDTILDSDESLGDVPPVEEKLITKNGSIRIRKNYVPAAPAATLFQGYPPYQATSNHGTLLIQLQSGQQQPPAAAAPAVAPMISQAGPGQPVIITAPVGGPWLLDYVFGAPGMAYSGLPMYAGGAATVALTFPPLVAGNQVRARIANPAQPTLWSTEATLIVA